MTHGLTIHSEERFSLPPSIEQNGKPKVDYTKLDKKQAVLTTVWALGITPLAINVIASTGTFSER